MLDKKTISFLQSRVAYVRDERSYQKLFYHFHPRLYRFCHKLIQNDAISEEIISDIMLKLWLMNSKLAYIDDLNLYIFKAVKNACLTYLSKKKYEFAQGDALENVIADTHANSEDPLLATEAAQQLENAIATLPPQCQMVFRLIREEGFSHRQVSQILEISQNTIETHMRLALQRIKKQLELYLNNAK